MVNAQLGISGGAEWLSERARSTFITAGAETVPVNRRVIGTFGEARWEAHDRINVQAGLRAEHITREQLATASSPLAPSTVVSINPKLAASWLVSRSRPAEGASAWTRVRVAAGTGIRPPDAFEIAFTDNPDLKPERSRSLELGVTQALAGGAIQIEATTFVNRYDDLIVSVGSLRDVSRYRTDNIANARARGARNRCAVALGRRHQCSRDLHVSRHRDPRGGRALRGSLALPGRGRTAAASDASRVGHGRMDDAASHDVRDGRGARGHVGCRASLWSRRRLFREPGPHGYGPGRVVSSRARYGRVCPGAQSVRPETTKRCSATLLPAAWRSWGFALLRADRVSFGYGSAARGRPFGMEGGTSVPSVLDNVSADIARGSIVGILGPNGSGKTTLLRLLSGTRRPTRGTVHLDGVPLERLSRRAIAQRMAVVPQETQLAFEYTVLEMVLMGRHPHLGLFELEGPGDFAVARDALAATGTAGLEDRRFSTLSGGEKQRVVIAAALAQSSEILLLDEPTASLDLGYQLEVASLLTGLNRERGVTIVVSTHDLEPCRRRVPRARHAA